MHKKYIVRLTDEERAYLRERVSTGTAAAYRIKHAILLQIDAERANWSDAQAAQAFCCGPRTVFAIRNVLSNKALRRRWSANHASARPLHRCWTETSRRG